MRLPLTAILTVYFLTFVIDYYNYLQFKAYDRKIKRRLPSRLYLASVAAGLLAVTVAVCLPRRSAEESVLPAMWLLYGWATLYIIKLLYAVFSLVGKIPAIFRRRSIDLGLWVGIPVGTALSAAMWWGALVTVRSMEITETEIVSPDIPASFDGYRIVQLSDLHVGTWGKDTAFVSSLVDEVNALKPDVVVFTGDIVNRQTSELSPFVSVLKRLKAPDGTYAILGNHDYGDYISWDSPKAKEDNLSALKSHFKEMGWVLLDNTHTYIRNQADSIALIGVGNWGEPPFHQYGNLSRALVAGNDTVDMLNPAAFAILLSHNPEHWNQIVSRKTGLHLTLSGHTHAMQMMISAGGKKWSPASWRYEQWGGLYERNGKNGKSRLYVNIGAGEVGIPARIGAVPEISLIVLRHQNRDAR